MQDQEMELIEHPVLGRMHFPHAPSIAEVTLQRDGRNFEIWVWGDGRSTSLAQIERVVPIADRIIEIDQQICAALAQCLTLRSNDSVLTYVEHHLEELDAQQLHDVLQGKPPTALHLLEQVRFLKASLFPDPDPELELPAGVVATFDYGLGLDLTQYLLAVQLDQHGAILSIDMES